MVCLKLKNNNIDGRKYQNLLYELIHNNETLTALDLGNYQENIKNRNRVYNEGFKAIIEAMSNSSTGMSMISELHL